MAKELRSIDITNSPDLLRMAEEIQRSQKPTVLVREAEELVEVRPVPAKRKRSSKGRPVTENDPLFRLIGIGRSGIPGGVSGKKHESLARAYKSHSD
jgi:hypothetical protein